MRYLFFTLFSIICLEVSAQQTEILNDSLYKPDNYYLEDQLYFGVSYIILRDLPTNVSQNGFSNQIKFGFIRDIPINEQRNFGFGLGLGYSTDTYYHNMRVSVDEQSGQMIYHLLEGEDYRTNSFTIRKIDIPFEIRLRGSSPKKFKFWRVYAGIITSYTLNAESEFTSSTIDIVYKKLNIVNKWNYGLSLSVGYGIWNFNLYYGLSDIIKENVKIDNQSVHLKTIHVGVIYYFL